MVDVTSTFNQEKQLVVEEPAVTADVEVVGEPEAANQEEPPPSPPEEAMPKRDDDVFSATLTREKAEEALGLKVDFADEKVLHVCGLISEGDTVVKRYNATAGERQIRTGDYIMSINGVVAHAIETDMKASDVLREQLLKTMRLDVNVSRPYIFKSEVNRVDQPSLGLDLSYSNSGISLIVRGISDGAVKKNASHKIEIGDRIVAVGSVEGGPHVLLKAVRDSGEKVTLTMSRPYT